MKKRLAAGVLALGLAAAAAVWVGRAPRFAHASPDYPMVDLTGVVARACLLYTSDAADEL